MSDENMFTLSFLQSQIPTIEKVIKNADNNTTTATEVVHSDNIDNDNYNEIEDGSDTYNGDMKFSSLDVVDNSVEEVAVGKESNRAKKSKGKKSKKRKAE